MNPVLTKAADFDFERGGPADRRLRRLDLVPRCVVLMVLAWLPLLILSWMQGQALGSPPRLSCLLDFATYARFFVALPLLLAAEVFVGPRLHRAALMWSVVVAGAFIGLSASFFFNVEDARLHGIQVLLLAAFIGLVIFMVLALDQPFRGDLGLRPDAYQLVFDQLMKTNP